MAYTGTGTQADPYVVTTFTDFLTCVAQDGVYVKVDADIDAAAEGYDYIEPINVAARKVYADSMKKISNVTIEGNAVMEFTSSSTQAIDVPSVMRLHLENWAWKAASNPYIISHVPIMFHRNLSTIGVVRYCKVSISTTAQTSDTNVKLQGRMAIMDSAFVMQLHGGQLLPQINNSDTKEKTTIRIEGSEGATYPASNSSGNRFGYCTNAGIILKGMTITGNPGFNGGNGFGYMVFEDCVMPSSGTVYAVNQSNLICFAGTTDASGMTLNGGTQITQAQLKDKSYLQSIGWLP